MVSKKTKETTLGTRAVATTRTVVTVGFVFNSAFHESCLMAWWFLVLRVRFFIFCLSRLLGALPDFRSVCVCVMVSVVFFAFLFGPSPKFTARAWFWTPRSRRSFPNTRAGSFSNTKTKPGGHFQSQAHFLMPGIAFSRHCQCLYMSRHPLRSNWGGLGLRGGNWGLGWGLGLGGGDWGFGGGTGGGRVFKVTKQPKHMPLYIKPSFTV